MINNSCKRILAIQDLSGFGHTSLLAEIPIMYRLGIRVCVLPTAILSANTDYPDAHWVDMDPHLERLAGHWKDLGLRFSAIHSGFLSSARQAGRIAGIIDQLRDEGTFVLVDPVMGDGGKLYSCFDAGIVRAMRELVGKADLITPNYSEAAWLAGADPSAGFDDATFLDWCRRISALGPRQIVVTSVPGDDPGRLEVRYFNSGDGTLKSYPYIIRGGTYPGAGDCFAAFVLAGVVNGYELTDSIRAAVEIMSLATGLEPSLGHDWREGIELEQVLDLDLEIYYRI
ncbi:MAG: pyridoxamine kinase [Candidatus Syntrophosphaera sp.]|nr:pyridoxamine kinase [Candidatus Syntrophosphaera sp.]